MIVLKRFLEGVGRLQECLGTRAWKPNLPNGHNFEARRVTQIAKALVADPGGYARIYWPLCPAADFTHSGQSAPSPTAVLDRNTVGDFAICLIEYCAPFPQIFAERIMNDRALK